MEIRGRALARSPFRRAGGGCKYGRSREDRRSRPYSLADISRYREPRHVLPYVHHARDPEAEIYDRRELSSIAHPTRGPIIRAQAQVVGAKPLVPGNRARDPAQGDLVGDEALCVPVPHEDARADPNASLV